VFCYDCSNVAIYHNTHLCCSRVNMFEIYSKGASLSRLDKLLESLSGHLVVDSAPANDFLSRVRQLITEKFPPPPSKYQNGQTDEGHTQQQSQPMELTESTATLPTSVTVASEEHIS
jgi:hypothetical protein